MSNFLYQLWPGHLGGFIFDEKTYYLTKGKRSPFIPPGIYEGIFNREIACGVHQMTSCDTTVMNDGHHYLSQRDRVNLSNEIHALTGRRSISIFIHANAIGDGKSWNESHGFRIFHGYNASSKSKLLASLLHDEFKSSTKLEPRSIVDNSRLIVLTQTSSPAVLIECGFMTNEKEATYLASENGQNEISIAISNAIEDFDNKFNPF